MIATVNSFLPETGQWLALGAVLITVAMFSGLGRIRGVAQDLPGVSILYGWSILAAALTVTGVFTPLAFAPTFWTLAAVAAIALIISVRRGTLDLRPIIPFFALGAPLLLIMAGKAPSEVDSFTHWLPNGLYIVEHDRFLHPDRPPARSAYPGFPYNVTFLFLAASKFANAFVENAVILANVTWLILFAAVIAWLLRRSAAIPAGNDWKLAAFALLGATLLNPVFVRRIWLTSYPDMATSIVVLFAGLAGWLWIEAMVRRDETEFAKAAGFGLLLALLINIKQANLVLVVALVAACGMVVMRAPKVSLRLYAKRLLFVLGLPLLLYFSWRYYLVEVTPLNENKILPFAKWPFDQIDDLLGKMGVVIFRKPLYFALAFGFVIWGLRKWLSRPKSEFDRLAIIVGASFIGYNLFLLFIFISHFGGHPQSYWRFNTHLGYFIVAAAIYGFGLAYRTFSSQLPASIPGILKRGAAALIVVVPFLELGLANYWRFDLEIPKPLLREAGKDLAKILPQSAQVAAVTPSDQGNFTSILGHYGNLGRPDLHVSAVNKPAQLAKFFGRSAGNPTFVWAYCPRDWVSSALGTEVPSGQAALFIRKDDEWKVARLWPLRTPGQFVSVYKLFDLAKCAEGG